MRYDPTYVPHGALPYAHDYRNLLHAVGVQCWPSHATTLYVTRPYP